MRKRITFSFIIIILLIFCGCQKTPDDAAVVNKADGELEKKINGPAASQQAVVTESDGKEGSEIIGEITYPKAWEETYEIPNLKCDINADVIMPAINEFPVYKVRQREFDTNSVEKIVNYFTADATGVRETSDTKEELEEQLVQAKRGAYFWDDNGGRWETYEGQEKDIAELEEKIAKAKPEVFAPVSDNGISVPMDKTYAIPNGERVYVKTTTKGVVIYPVKYAIIQPESWITIGEAYPGEPVGTTLDNVKISEKEAKNMTTKLLSDLEIEDMGIAKTEKARILKDISFVTVSEGWQITLARNDGGCIPVYINSSEVYGMLYYPSEDYIERWQPESIKIYVDENGPRSFIWKYPLEVVEELNSNVPILPLDEIKGRVRNYIKYVFIKKMGDGKVPDLKISVNKMILTDVLLPMKDESEYHMLVPAWIVYYEFKDGLGIHTSILAVNAIDGSSIDLALRLPRQER